MSQVTLRAPAPEDIPALTELTNLPGVRRGTLRLPHTATAWVAERVNASAPDEYPLVAVLEGQAIGWSVLVRKNGRMAHVGEIGISVHDAHVGTGIGTAMMAELIDIADNWLGLTRVQLDLDADNAAALALYRRFGFEIEGRLRAFVLRDGELIDGLMMARLRPPPALPGATE